MLWKRLSPPDPYPTYLAVVEAREMNPNKHPFGRREFRLRLSDDTTVDHVFEKDECERWWSTLLDGGQVVNP